METRGEAGKAWVRSVYGGGESSEEKVLEVRRFETTPARVKVGLGMTYQPKEFHSIRVDVGVELPCYVEEVDACYEDARRRADSYLRAEKKKLDDFYKKREG